MGTALEKVNVYTMFGVLLSNNFTQATQGMTMQLNMHILVKCYLERFASINDPENWTTNVA